MVYTDCKAQSRCGVVCVVYFCESDGGVCRGRYVGGRRGNNALDEKACPLMYCKI